MRAAGKRPIGLAATASLLVFGIGLLGLLGFVLVVAGRRAPEVFAETYDLSPGQTAEFVVAASSRLGWTKTQVPGKFETPDGSVRVRIDPFERASKVRIDGPRRGVRALSQYLDRKIPPLQDR